jgi:His-Xaa-Ser system protein HxsD
MNGTATPWIITAGNGSLSIAVDTRIYPLDVISRTCFAFTARAYVFMRSIDKESVRVDIAAHDGGSDASLMACEFTNALLEQSLRARIAEETRSIRELIVAQAFCEGDLLDRADVEADPADDPRHITSRR